MLENWYSLFIDIRMFLRKLSKTCYIKRHSVSISTYFALKLCYLGVTVKPVLTFML